MKRNGHDDLTGFLPGIISLTRLPDGTAIARIEEIGEWLTVREACDQAHCGEDLIYARVDDGTLTHRWKNHEGERGTILIHAGSFKMFLDARTRLGSLHPRFDLK